MAEWSQGERGDDIRRTRWVVLVYATLWILVVGTVRPLAGIVAWARGALHVCLSSATFIESRGEVTMNRRPEEQSARFPARAGTQPWRPVLPLPTPLGTWCQAR